MAHPVQPMGLYKKISSSRYYNQPMIYYSEKRYVTLELYKKDRTANAPGPNDLWAEIPKQYEYRPDKMSNEAFGTPDFWWRLLEANGMKDIMEFKAGTDIRIPGGLLN